MLPLGPAFRSLRQTDPSAWLRALDTAMVSSRSLDLMGLPSWGGIARVANVGEEWLRYIVRTDELTPRYRYLPWRPVGKPTGDPGVSPARFDRAIWLPESLTAGVFQYPTFHLDVVALLQDTTVSPCASWLDPTGYLRVEEHLTENQRTSRSDAVRPVLAIQWWGGPFPIEGWGAVLSAGHQKTRALPCLCFPWTAVQRHVRLPRTAASRPSPALRYTTPG